AAVALSNINAYTVGTADNDLACFAELDFLARILDRVECNVGGKSELLGLGEHGSHPLDEGHRLFFNLRRGFLAFLSLHWQAAQHKSQCQGHHELPRHTGYLHSPKHESIHRKTSIMKRGSCIWQPAYLTL